MKLRTAAYLSCGLIAASAAVFFFQPPARTALPITPPGLSPPSSFATKPVRFSDVSLQWRLHLEHQQTAEQLTALTETLGSGVCIIDANRDGWMDVFFVGGSGHTRHYGKKAWWYPSRGNRLLLNKNGKYFEDVTASAGLHTEIHGMGCAVADLDNDGLRDLIVTGMDTNLLYRNKGNLSFEDLTASSGIENDAWSTGASIADFNGDGLLDIYIANYVLFRKGARTFERTSGFKTTLDSSFDPTLYDPAPNRLYLNLGSFRFRDVSQERGVSNSLGRSLGARWIDDNNDTWPDLLVINDAGTPNQLYLNEEGKTFSRVGDSHSPLEVEGAHDVSFADFDGDGHDEILMTRSNGSHPILLRRSDARAEYNDTARASGLAQSRLLPLESWGSASADFNNDGFLDVYVANGSILPDADSQFVPQPQPNSLFLGDGWGQFYLQNPSADPGFPYSSRAAVTSDLDNDGQLEVLVTNNNDVLQVLAAEKTTGNWLVLDLTHSYNDVTIFGATLTLETETRTIRRTLAPPMGFLSQGDARTHVGLGTDSEIRSLRINWRDGTSIAFENVSPNQVLSVEGPENKIVPKATAHLPPASTYESLAGLDGPTLLSLFRLMSLDGVQDQGVLEAIWAAAAMPVRESILEHLGDRPNIFSLSILKRALRDPSPQIRLAAVTFLKKAELEMSISWLIPLLDDKAPAVRCLVAETFESFFEEEEAVTHRKRLALSPLIRKLESLDSATRRCAANALASAEDKRAVLPLIALAQKSTNVEEKTAAIRALGRVRDRRAVRPLWSLIEDSSSDAHITAVSLIALSRLGVRDPLVRFFSSEGSTQAAEVVQRLDVLTELFTESEGVVFSKTNLQAQLDRLIEANSQAVLQGDSHLRKRVAAIKAIGAGKANTHLDVLIGSIDSGDLEIRTEALVALARLNTLSARQLLEARLRNEPLAILQAVIHRLGQGDYRFSPQLIQRMASQNKTFSDALAILKSMPPNRASPIFDSLLSMNLDERQKAVLLDLCVSSNLTPSAPDREHWTEGSPQARIRYAECFLKRAGALSTKIPSSKIRLMTRRMLTSILSEAQWDPDTRARLIIAASQHDEMIARALLSKQIASIPDRQLPDAYRALITHEIAEPLEGMLWENLKGEQYSSEVRLLAAELLATIDLDSARDYVREHFLEHRETDEPSG